MSAIFVLLIPVVLLLFWAWMFVAMSKNEALPNCFLTITNGRDARLDWTVAFVVFSVVTAGYYYWTTYRDDQPAK